MSARGFPPCLPNSHCGVPLSAKQFKARLIISINDRIKPIIRFTTINLLGVFPFDAIIIHPNLKTVLKEMGLHPLFLTSYPNTVLENTINPSRFS